MSQAQKILRLSWTSAGCIVACNAAAEDFFGLTSREIEGKFCGEIIRGADECGFVCSRDCSLLDHIKKGVSGGGMDLQVHTAVGRKWCLVTSLALQSRRSERYGIHVLHPIDKRKRLEMLLLDMIHSGSASMLSTPSQNPTKLLELTKREVQLLRMLSRGMTTKTVARSLGISMTTVNNHVQHILAKLNAHSRLQAVQRAVKAGLI